MKNAKKFVKKIVPQWKENVNQWNKLINKKVKVLRIYASFKNQDFKKASYKRIFKIFWILLWNHKKIIFQQKILCSEIR